ncbi:MAG: DUF721 domain-containing protein [Gemmatimonadetes bacterium]|nr:DUF721 domain-containing protein [Gemmatimonadota bacterium]MYE18161.1 DUF721 domain-containing protein [Gemmatimonadota bacterium]
MGPVRAGHSHGAQGVGCEVHGSHAGAVAPSWRSDRSVSGTRGNDSGPRRFEPVADALRGYLERTGLDESLQRLGALDEWADAVGPRVARVTRAVEVRGDTLVVEVLSSAWNNELTMMKGLILERLNTVCTGPPIGGIRFRLAETAETVGKARKVFRANA